jgi:hypothetical protein
MAISDAAISAAAGLVGVWIGVRGTAKVAGEFWRRERIEATGPLVEARIKRYASLLKLTESGPEETPKAWTAPDLAFIDQQLRRWFYTECAGLLLSQRTQDQWRDVRKILVKGQAIAAAGPLDDQHNKDIQTAMSCLRTRLKQDIHVHGEDIDDAGCSGGLPAWARDEGERT